MVGKILKAVTGRLARNIYFWALLIYTRTADPTHTRWQTAITLILILLLAILTYTNNLVLVPRFLAKKKNWQYFILAVPLCFFISFCYELTLKLMLHYFPHYTVDSVSLFVGHRTTGILTFSAVINEMEIGGAVSMLIIFTMAWYLTDYGRKQKAMEEAKKKQIEAELLFLKGQINPHFLFNTLNNLYGLCLSKSDNSADAVLKLSAILRYLLYESNSEKVPFSKEKEIMLAYIDLELLRLSERDNLNFSITSDSDRSIPPLLWLPVLENVFKHGTRLLDDAYTIDYSFALQHDLLTIYSKNNYDTRNNNNGLEKSGGIGLNNLKHRLEILYPGKYIIETNRDDEYYIAKVEINLK